MNLNQLLKNFRLKNNFTQEELAQKLYVTHQTISKWEQGINTPSIDNLLLLSDLYNVSLDELIRGGNYLKKPFVIGKKVTKLRTVTPVLIWLFLSFFFTSFTSNWISFIIFILGIIFLFPASIEDFWIIKKRGLSIQLFSTSSIKKVKNIFELFFHPNNVTTFISYEDIKSFEIVYLKRDRYSPFDLNPDTFFIKIRTNSGEKYDLPISQKFTNYLPQACLFLEKKNIVIIDKNNIINAITNKINLFEYMNKNEFE